METALDTFKLWRPLKFPPDLKLLLSDNIGTWTEMFGVWF